MTGEGLHDDAWIDRHIEGSYAHESSLIKRSTPISKNFTFSKYLDNLVYLMEQTLAVLSIECAQLFDNLTRILINTPVPFLLHGAVEDQYARFKIWAGNMGAFHRSTSGVSLDHRLRNSQRIAEHVRSLLCDLVAALKDG